MYKAIFFDLDGTLLPMDLKEFLERYLHLVGAFFQTKGYDGRQVCDGIMKNLEAMLAGSEDRTTNEERFWAGFPSYMSQTYGQSAPWVELFEVAFKHTLVCRRAQTPFFVNHATFLVDFLTLKQQTV